MVSTEEIIINGDLDRMRAITARMSMYASNIAGSNSYLYKKRKELEALFESKGMPTLWFTFSAADNHWLDLHHIELHPIDNTLNQKEKATVRRKFIWENPHIVDSIFMTESKS